MPQLFSLLLLLLCLPSPSLSVPHSATHSRAHSHHLPLSLTFSCHRYVPHTAHCRGGTALFHHSFYPHTIHCTRPSSSSSSSPSSPSWACTPRGPRAALVAVRSPRITCSFPATPDTCALSYKLDFRAAVLAAVAAAAAAALFGSFALATHVSLVAMQRAASGRRQRTGMRARRRTGGEQTCAQKSAAVPASVRADVGGGSGGQGYLTWEEEAEDLEAAVLRRDAEKEAMLREEERERREFVGRLQGYGSYARMIVRNFSEASLHFSSAGPSPPGSPPVGSVGGGPPLAARFAAAADPLGQSFWGTAVGSPSGGGFWGGGSTAGPRSSGAVESGYGSIGTSAGVVAEGEDMVGAPSPLGVAPVLRDASWTARGGSWREVDDRGTAFAGNHGGEAEDARRAVVTAEEEAAVAEIAAVEVDVGSVTGTEVDDDEDEMREEGVTESANAARGKRARTRQEVLKAEMMFEMFC